MSAAVIESLKDEIAALRMRVKAIENGQTITEPTKGKRAKKEKDPDAPKKELSAWAISLKEVYAPLIRQALDGKKQPAGFGLKIAGYLKSQGNMKPSLEDVKKAIEFLEEHPDHKSDTAKTRSESGSVGEKKPRGRPSKANDGVKKTQPEVVTPKAEQEESEEEEEEDEWVKPRYSSFNWKGVEYMKEDEDDELFTADGDMDWVGSWTGKKIVKGTPSERVKRILATQEEY